MVYRVRLIDLALDHVVRIPLADLQAWLSANATEPYVVWQLDNSPTQEFFDKGIYSGVFQPRAWGYAVDFTSQRDAALLRIFAKGIARHA